MRSNMWVRLACTGFVAAACLAPTAAMADPDDLATAGSGGCVSVTVTKQGRTVVARININGCSPRQPVRAVAQCSWTYKNYGPAKWNVADLSSTSCSSPAWVSRYGYQYGKGAIIWS